jgi:FkbM family methyltransferase
MKLVDGWYWPDGEQHMLEWIADPKNRVMLNGRPAYQGKKQLLALEHCPQDRCRRAIDCGAHIGLWSYNFAHWFESVEAFEPVGAHRDCWVANVDAAPRTAMLYPFALGDREAMVNIRVNPTSTGDSWVKGSGTVPMRTLDSFNFEDVDFIKVDAEGYEEFILRGAEQTLRKWKPVICVEQKRDMAVKFGLKPMGAVQFLVGLGYKVVGEISGDYILKVPV